MSVVIERGDCLETMRSYAELGIEVDAIVTDPPYHLTSIVRRFGKQGSAPAKSDGATGVFARASAGFMGKEWDGGDIAFRPETWELALRVLKPGGHLLAFGAARGYHRMAVAIEDAGFEVRDCIMWLYGTGFPKSHAVDRLLERMGREEAPAWEGWGTALKPAYEPIVVARKPLVGTVAENILAHGTGALNVDGCRIPHASADDLAKSLSKNPGRSDHVTSGVYGGGRPQQSVNLEGRWPANVIHDGSGEVLEAFERYGERGASAPVKGTEPSAASAGIVTGKRARVPGVFHDDSGTAARFFYSAKASSSERVGKHPTQKPLALMRYLVRLVTPPGGIVLDPFAGSGTTGEAAILEGFSAVLCEREEEYLADIEARIARAKAAIGEASSAAIRF